MLLRPNSFKEDNEVSGTKTTVNVDVTYHPREKVCCVLPRKRTSDGFLENDKVEGEVHYGSCLIKDHQGQIS